MLTATVLAMSLLLTGCLSGSGGGETGGTSGQTATAGETSGAQQSTEAIEDVEIGDISLNISPAAPNTSETVIVTATVTDDNGLLVPDGITVNFSMPTGNAFASINPVAVGTSGGIATTYLTPSGKPTQPVGYSGYYYDSGECWVRATVSADDEEYINWSGSAYDTVNVVFSPPSSVSLAASSTLASPGESITITALPVYGDGTTPRSGIPIAFYVEDLYNTLNESDFGQIQPMSTETNNSGIATATFTVDEEAVGGRVTIYATTQEDAYDSKPYDIINSIDIDIIPLGTIGLSAASSSINPDDTTTITAKAYTPSGLPMEGATLFLTLSNPTLGQTPPSVTTGADGTVNFVFTARDEPGNVYLTATDASGEHQSDPLKIVILDPASNPPASIALTVGTDPVLVTKTSSITADVDDASGAAVDDGTTVFFEVMSDVYGTITETAVVSGGTATATFTAFDQPGTAYITATCGTATATTSLVVEPADAASIEYSPTDANGQEYLVNPLGIQGSGKPEVTDVYFYVRDENGNPANDVDVVVTMTSRPNGGEYINQNDADPTQATVSTSNGYASVTLHSGTSAGPVTLRAVTTVTPDTGAPYNIVATAPTVYIGGGVPSDKWLSISVADDGWNIAGYGYDGLEADLTIALADRFGNYNMLDGHVVSAQAEAGLSIGPGGSSGQTEISNGEAVITVKTQASDQGQPCENVLPEIWELQLREYLTATFGPGIPLGHPRDGACSLLFFTRGEEHFFDGSNGGDLDGVYNAGESFTDTAQDPFRDYNDNDLYDDGDSDNDGLVDAEEVALDQDLNGNGTPDSQEDMDNDGIMLAMEDFNQDGIPDWLDENLDGIPNYLVDDNGNGIDDWKETNANGFYNWIDEDGQSEVTSITCVGDAGGSLSGKYFTLSSPGTDYYAWYSQDGNAEVTNITCVGDTAGALGGTYFTIASPANDYHVWYNFPAAEKTRITIPAVPGNETNFRLYSPNTNYHVWYNRSEAEVTDITFSGTPGNNTYFYISSPSTAYYVWYNMDGGGADPAPGGTGIEVEIISADTAASTAAKTAAQVDAQSAFSASSSGSVLTVVNADAGEALNPVDGTTGSIAVANQNEGVSATEPYVAGSTGIEVEIAESASTTTAVAQATATAIAAESDFTASQSGNTVTVTCVDNGDATLAADDDAGVSVNLLTDGNLDSDPAPAGSNPIEVTLARNAIAATVAEETASAINAEAAFSATSTSGSATFTLTNASVGTATDAADGGVPTGMTFNVTTQGSAGSTDPAPGGTGIEIGITSNSAAEIVADATATALNARTDFSAVVPTEHGLAVQIMNTTPGACTDAADGDAGVSPVVIIDGAGGANNGVPLCELDPYEDYTDASEGTAGVWDGINGTWDDDKYIFRNHDMMVTGYPTIMFDGGFLVPNGGSDTVKVLICDSNLNELSAGTSFTITTTVGEISSGVTEHTYAGSGYGPDMAGQLGLIEFPITISDPNPATSLAETGVLTVTIQWENEVWGGGEISESVGGTVY